MNKEAIKKYRMFAVALFAVSAIVFTLAMSMKGNTLFLLSGLVAFGSMAFVLFTEGFLYPVSERSKFSIYAARFFFFLSILMVLELLLTLVRHAV